MYEIIQSAKEGKPLAPITVIVPTRLVGLKLRRGVGEGEAKEAPGLLNVKFLDLKAVADFLATPTLSQNNKKPITDIVRLKATELALRSVPGFSRLSGHEASVASIAKLLDDVRNSGDRGAIAGSLGEVQAEYSRLTQGFVSPEPPVPSPGNFEGLSLAPLQEKGHQPAQAIGQVSPLDPLRMGTTPVRTSPTSPSGRGLESAGRPSGLESMPSLDTAERKGRGYYDDRDIYEAATKAILQGSPELKELGNIILGEMPSGLRAAELALWQALEKIAFASTEGQDTTPDCECWILPDTEQECRMATRKIAKLAAEGVPLHRIAVLFPSSELYLRVTSETMRRAEIPYNGRQDRKQVETPAGRMLSGFFNVLDSGYRRSQVIEWLCSVPIVHKDKLIVPHRWDRLSKKARVLKGLSSWRLRMKQQIALVPDSLDPDVKDYIKAHAEEAASIIEFLEDLDVFANAFLAVQSWADFAKWSDNLFRQWLPRSVRNTTEFELLDTALEALDGLSDLVPNPSSTDFRSAVAHLLEQPVGARSPFGRGVFVGTIKEAFGLKFDATIILGMTAANLPKTQSQFLLPKEEADALGLPGSEQLIREQREQFEKIRSSSGRVYFSCPRADLRSMREAIPSHWFMQEVAEAAGKEYVGAKDLEELQDPKLIKLDSFEMALREEAVGSRQEFNLRALANEDFSVLPEPIVQRFESAGGMIAARVGDTVSPFDGAVSLDETPRFSATSLEDFGTCPFRFFLGRILRLKKDEEITDPWALDHLTKGSAVHGALKAFYEQSLPIAADRVWGPEDHARLQTILDAELNRLEEQGHVQDSPLWRFNKVALKQSLARYLDRDSEARLTLGRPILFEFGFGLGEEPLEFELEGIPLALRGSIDRIDFNDEMGIATVIDYKTGSGRKYNGLSEKNPLLSGQLFQLPLYGEVLKRQYREAGLGQEPRVNAEYQFIELANGKSVRKLDLDEAQEQFRSNLATLKSLTDQGLFPAAPGGFGYKNFENCEFCKFDTLCAAKRDEFWKLKKSDSRIAAFVAMAENDMREDENEQGA